MIDISKKKDLISVLNHEKKIVDYYNEYETNIKNSLETYVDEFKDIKFDNEILKTMILNNFASAIILLLHELVSITWFSSPFFKLNTFSIESFLSSGNMKDEYSL